MLNAFVDFEFGVGFEIFADGGLGVVARTPGTVGGLLGRQVFDNGIEHDTAATDAGARGVGLLG